jgi:hypothetical protein
MWVSSCHRDDYRPCHSSVDYSSTSHWGGPSSIPVRTYGISGGYSGIWVGFLQVLSFSCQFSLHKMLHIHLSYYHRRYIVSILIALLNSWLKTWYLLSSTFCLVEVYWRFGGRCYLEDGDTELSVIFYQTALRYIPEYGILNFRLCYHFFSTVIATIFTMFICHR